jgi:hypothetical protein
VIQKAKKASDVRTSDRYNAINLGNYLDIIRVCQCGSMALADSRSCSCLRPSSRPTVEFRLWNATLNARKARTYVSISTAIVEAAAKNDSQPKDGWDDTFGHFHSVRDAVSPGDMARMMRELLAITPKGQARRDLKWIVDRGKVLEQR